MASRVGFKYEPQVYALFRIVLGFLFLAHGSQKLFGVPGGSYPDVSAFVRFVAGPIEFFGGILIMVGLFAHLAAFVASGTMAVAYWTVHGLQSFWPISNGGELAVLYCFAFLAIAGRGAGVWSLDEQRRASRAK